MINLSIIRIDGGTQIRAELNQDTVSAYADAYLAGVDFPPVVVFFDGKDHWLADGFHRFFAAKKAGKTAILESITTGTKRDAILFSLGANGTHGLNRTNADKRNAVTTMLQDPEWAAWSDNAIAKACHVSHPFVGSVRISILKPLQDATVTRTVERNGKTYKQNTANIGKAAPEAPARIPVPAAEPEQSDSPPDYTPLDAANDQIGELQAMLAVRDMGDVPEEEKLQASALIAELQKEVKTLSETLKATQFSRDRLMEEVAQLKRQCLMNMRELKKPK